MKFKSLALAVLTATAGAASGALLKDGYTPGAPSDVLVAVYDDSTGLASSGKTFLFNTRLSYADFVNGVIGSRSIDLSADPNFQALKLDGAKLKFNVVGAYSLANDFSNYDKTGSSGKVFSDPASTQWGVVTSGKNSADFNGQFGNVSDTAKARVIAYWNAANVKLAAAGATATGGPDSVLVDKGDPRASFDLAWGGNFGGGGIANIAAANIGSVGQAVKFLWVTNTDFDKGSVVELGSWTLSDGGRLTYAGSGGGGNQPPVAKAGSNQTVAVGATVTLDGSGSTDPNGDSLSFAWSQVSGPSVTLTGATAAKATFTAANSGTYVFKLTVSDGTAGSEATVQVIVGNGLGDGPGIRIQAPASWKAKSPQVITFIGNEIKPNKRVKFSFSKNGVKFKAIRAVPFKRGRLVWKPKPKDVSTQGVLRACVRYDRKKPPACDQVNVVVQP